MKKVIYLFISAVLLFFGCTEKVGKTGSISGVVTDKATGEPVRVAGVKLSTGGTYTTGNDGFFEFQELSAGEYTLQVTKTGYSDLTGYQVTVAGGKNTPANVQLEKLPPSLRIVNDNKKDISELDFGNALSDLTRSFNIFNDGVEPLEWDITFTTSWITSVSKTSGKLNAGATQAIVITIDREKLDGGENTTTMHITSDNGSKQLTVKATGEVKILPTLNTHATTNITTTTAILNGEILTDGTPAYTERGFVYSLSPMPTLENTITKVTATVTATKTYAATVSGLTLGKTYYVRAYATNKVGTAYSSNEVSFQPEATLPAVTTQAVTNVNITAGTATFNGTIVSLGDPAYTERGFVYGLQRNPTIDDDTKKTVSGTGMGVFSSNISSGLTVGKTYYVRAYAKNASGTVYGSEVVCDFAAVMPEVTTQAVTNKSIAAGLATFNGTIVKIGDPAYSERGFVYSLQHNPSLNDGTKKTVSGTGTGIYSFNMTGLTIENVYYVRAYATNSSGTVYGSEVTCDFKAIMPVVTTKAVSNINGTTATFNGSITNIGDPAYTERGFVYANTQNPDIENDTKVKVTGNGTGDFSAAITALIEGTTYYVRAYATNSQGTAYGAQVSFKAEHSQYVVLQSANIMVHKTDITSNEINWTSANNLCKNSTIGGYTNWRIPTLNELSAMYNERNTIGGFKSTVSGYDAAYWTSTSYSSSMYYQINFANGSTQYYYSSDSYSYSYNSVFYCRCVRTLP